MLKVAAALSAMLAFLPAAALADYTYSLVVPVTGKQLPAASSLQALCKLFPGVNGAGDTLGYFTSPQTSVTGGTFSGNLTVTATTTAGAASYRCFLFVYVNGKVINSGGNYEILPTGWFGIINTKATNL